MSQRRLSWFPGTALLRQHQLREPEPSPAIAVSRIFVQEPASCGLAGLHFLLAFDSPTIHHVFDSLARPSPRGPPRGLGFPHDQVP